VPRKAPYMKLQKARAISAILLVCIATVGCRPKPMPLDQAMKLIDNRQDWQDRGPIQIPRIPSEKFLKGMTIVIDPGHGGADGGDATTKPAAYKAGPTGVKEAHMNLRVSLLLERLLKDAGVNVILTRHGDDTVSLTDRAEVANTAKRPGGGIGADLFISIHHNAAGKSHDPANFTSIFYHGEVDDAEVALDVARHIAAHLGPAMRTNVGVSGPLYSDFLMFPGWGFGVLRACKVPAVLCECSFYTNPEEEQRLRDAGYNLREAYAIYAALCEYAYEGRPTQSVPNVEVNDSTVTLTMALDEGLPGWWGKERNRILRSTMSATWDGKPMAVVYNATTKLLIARAPLLEAAPIVMA
jgi:N-acetylmuramoyl-L-alanine amidase